VPTNECRICFGVASPEEIAEGVCRLRRAVGRVMEGDRNEKPLRVAAR